MLMSGCPAYTITREIGNFVQGQGRRKFSPMGGTSRLIESSLWVVTTGAGETNAYRGKYMEYFEDSAEGCAVRLEKLHWRV